MPSCSAWLWSRHLGKVSVHSPSLRIACPGILSFSRQRFTLAAIVLLIGAAGVLIFNSCQYGQLQPPMKWETGSPLAAMSHYFVDRQTSVFANNYWLVIVAIGLVVSFLPGVPRPQASWWVVLLASLPSLDFLGLL